MKIAITSQGTCLESPVDERFGRAKYILVVDTEDESFEAVDNEINLNAAQGAGIQAAQTVSRQGVKALLTGHCGPKAFQTLSAAGIEVYTGASGTIQEALTAFKAGQLKSASDADVEGHWM